MRQDSATATSFSFNWIYSAPLYMHMQLSEYVCVLSGGLIKEDS